MAAFHLPPLRHAFGNKGASCLLRGIQKRHAQVHDVRFLVTHQESDRVIEKYKDKLEVKVKECAAIVLTQATFAYIQHRAGLKDVKELKAAYHSKILEQRNCALPLEFASLQSSSKHPTAPSPPPHTQSFSLDAHQVPTSTKAPDPPGVKTLSSYIDVPKTLELPQKEIEYIWRLRHASDPQSLCAVIPLSVYIKIDAAARRHPQFILPLPRDNQGAEFHYLQWTFPSATTTTVLFTHLAEFKLRGEYAQPHTTITHHLDIVGPKDMVLLQGTVVEGRGITVNEGKWLLMCLQKFYGGHESEERRKLMRQFSQGDRNFKVESLLAEAESIV